MSRLTDRLHKITSEQTIIEGVGPQAIIAGPQIAPDGKSGFARLDCCLSRDILSFALPLTSEKPKQGPAGAFLDPETREVSMVKALCGELVNRVTYACLQFHGGYGYMREFAIERMARDARIQSIGGGATEVMLEEVAKRM